MVGCDLHLLESAAILMRHHQVQGTLGNVYQTLCLVVIEYSSYTSYNAISLLGFKNKQLIYGIKEIIGNFNLTWTVRIKYIYKLKSS